MGRRILVSLVLVTILVMGIPVVCVQAWSGSGTFGPTTVYQGESTQFTFTLRETRGDSTDVYYVFVHFCWQSSGWGHYFKEDDGTKISIPAGGSRSFTEYVSVSGSHEGSCKVEIEVKAKAVGDWWSEEKDFTTSITVKEILPLQVSASGNPNSGGAPLTVHFSTSVSGGLSPYTHSWTFGDGSSSSQKNPTHTYSSSGTYTAKVTVRDDATNMQTKSDSISIHVSESTGGEGGFSASVGPEFLLLLVVLLVVVIVVAVALKGRKKRPAVYQTHPPQETYSRQEPYPPEQTGPSDGNPPGF